MSQSLSEIAPDPVAGQADDRRLISTTFPFDVYSNPDPFEFVRLVFSSTATVNEIPPNLSSLSMQVLPVLDLLNGIVVRGIAGRRSEYQPIQSVLTARLQPLEVARSLRNSFEFSRFYVADLDAILHHRPNWDAYAQLIEDGFQLLIDAGIRDVESASRIRNAGAEPIVGLESCLHPQSLIEIVVETAGEMTFSLDLLNGQPQFAPCANTSNGTPQPPNATDAIRYSGIDHSQTWDSDPKKIARQVIRCGVQQLIVLDLADVGTSSGGRTDQLCRSLLDEFPNLRLICGGGVRGIDDLLRFKSLGATDVLVASALHDGRLKRADIDRL